MIRPWILLGIVVLALAFAGLAQAQELDPRRQPADTLLTLTEALELAAQNHPQILQARNAVDRAGAERLVGRTAFLPSVSTSTGFDVTRTRRFTTQDVFGDPTEREEAVEATTRGANQRVFLDLTLFDGGENLAAMRAAGDRYKVSVAALDAAWTDVRADVALAYFDALERWRTIAVERAILDARQRDVDTTERLFRVVSADQIDVLGARIDVLRQEGAVANAEEAAARGRLQLAEAIGSELDPRTDLALPLEPFDPESLDIDVLVNQALAGHPEVVGLREEAEAARAEAWGKGWLDWLPQVSASASYSRSEFGGTDTPFLNLDPRNSAWGFSLAFTLPLFDRFRRNLERVQADVAAENTRLDVRARELRAETDVRSRFLDLKSAYRQLKIEEETTGMARERADLARQKYQIGALDFTSLQQIIDQATAAERTLVQRLFNYYRALVELERAVGTPLPVSSGNPVPDFQPGG